MAWRAHVSIGVGISGWAGGLGASIHVPGPDDGSEIDPVEEAHERQLVARRHTPAHPTPLGLCIVLVHSLTDSLFLVQFGSLVRSVRMFVRACARACVRSFVRSFVLSFIHSFIRSLVLGRVGSWRRTIGATRERRGRGWQCFPKLQHHGTARDTKFVLVCAVVYLSVSLVFSYFGGGHRARSLCVVGG